MIFQGLNEYLVSGHACVIKVAESLRYTERFFKYLI